MSGRVVVLFDRDGDVAVMPEDGVDVTVLVIDERKPLGSRTSIVRERAKPHVLDHYLKTMRRNAGEPKKKFAFR